MHRIMSLIACGILFIAYSAAMPQDLGDFDQTEDVNGRGDLDQNEDVNSRYYSGKKKRTY